MSYRILYFYKIENAFYREKKGNNLVLTEKESGEEIKLYYCGLPEYYGKQVRWGRRRGRRKLFGGNLFSGEKSYSGKRSYSGENDFSQGDRIFPIAWNLGQLLRLMQNCCEYVSADAYYLEEQFEKELSEGELGFTPGRQRMCVELFWKLTERFRGIDSILYLSGDGETEAGELPLSEELLRKLHYFFYLGERAKQYDVLEETLWEEYGMPLLQVKKAEELITCQIKRLLVLDDRQGGVADWAVLPRGCVYLDLWSDGERYAQIAKNRVDIKYVSEYLYLRRNLDT